VSLFDQLVNEALRARADLSSLRPVVEKELLRHDILREDRRKFGQIVASKVAPAGKIDRLKSRYGLPVRKLVIETRPLETRPGRKRLPAQRINLDICLDICTIPSHDPRPMMLRNLYGVDLGTSGLTL
jgi:hypothetical protein